MEVAVVTQRLAATRKMSERRLKGRWSKEVSRKRSLREDSSSVMNDFLLIHYKDIYKTVDK
jgi:hypothetical protein